MENASEALMMAFGVLIFVLALTVAITSFSQARDVSDSILYMTDETNYYDYEITTGGASQNRFVGLESIIPTLYKYYKENYTVLFREGDYDMQTGKCLHTIPLTIYKTPNKRNWRLYDKSVDEDADTQYKNKLIEKYGPYFSSGFGTDFDVHNIFSFDLEEEQMRNEPWTANYNEQCTKNLEAFLNGGTYLNPNYLDEDVNSKYIKYDNFAEQNRTTRFVETIGEYEYSSTQAIDTDDGSSVSEIVKNKPKKKRIIIYTKVNRIINNEVDN